MKDVRVAAVLLARETAGGRIVKKLARYLLNVPNMPELVDYDWLIRGAPAETRRTRRSEKILAGHLAFSVTP